MIDVTINNVTDNYELYKKKKFLETLRTAT